jgi:DNA-binding response OmpR family regulator
LKESSIIIVHPDRRTQRVVQRVLGAGGYRIEVADDIAQAERIVSHLAPLLVVVDGEIVLAGRADGFFAAAHSRGTEACIALLSDRNYQHMPSILDMGAVTNLMVHPMPLLAEELTVTAHKLIRRDLFGVEKYLLWGTVPARATLMRASHRAALVERVAEAVRSTGQSPRVASMAMLITDELLSNAVHNAPIDADGVHYRRELSRDIEIDLDARHQVELRWACDARYLAIEVSDQFGSLDRGTILRSLSKSDVNPTGGGAGMGIALTYRSCDHLVFNLAPGRRTEIIALVNVRHPPLERVPASSFNIFVERESA